MFPDNTLTPKEAIRLCALGTLARGDRSYAALASDVRNFAGHMLGPSLDLMGPSLELLKLEGLVSATSGSGDSADLAITGRGTAELRKLLTANIRVGGAELNKLVLALKFRFLDLLAPEVQADEVQRIYDHCDNELSRLEAVRMDHADEPGALSAWLDHDIELMQRRMDWIDRFRKACMPPGA
jgi:DNA-binding PadR family transcriptional regulator